MLRLYLAKLLLFIQDSLLSVINRLLFSQRLQLTDPQTILFFRTAALGDFLFAVPSMVALRRRFPKAKIVLLTTPTTNTKHRRLVQNYIESTTALPWLSFMVPFTIDDTIYFYSLNLRYLLQEIKPKIAKLNPDMTFILSHPGDPGIGLLKKILFLRLVGVKKSVYGWRMRSSIQFLRKTQHTAGLIEHKIMGPLRAVTECELMPRIGDIKIEFPLNISQEAERWADNFWRERNLEHKWVVAVAPGSIQPHKRWPVDKFSSLCQKLLSKYHVSLVMIGTKEDFSVGEIIINTSQEILNLAGKISIPQAAALLKRCVLLVGNDGGAMHLGAAMGCPSVSIVPGIEYPGSIEPWGNFDLAVRHAVPCAPCYCFTHCPKKHNKCIVDIPIEDVFLSCSSVLDKLTKNNDSMAS